jgi:hypothetical protein
MDGAVSTVGPAIFAVGHAQLTPDCTLMDGRGKMTITAKVVDVEEKDKPILEAKEERDFKDVREVLSICFRARDVVFPHAGEYKLQIWAGTQLLGEGERKITCKERSISHRQRRIVPAKLQRISRQRSTS